MATLGDLIILIEATWQADKFQAYLDKLAAKGHYYEFVNGVAALAEEWEGGVNGLIESTMDGSLENFLDEELQNP